MLKRNVIKITVSAVSLFAYAAGCVSAACSGFSASGKDVLGFFFWDGDGVLCLLNSFVWIFLVFLLGMSLMGFFGILPILYLKMYTLGFSVTAVAVGGSDGLVFVLLLLPEILLLFIVFSEMGGGAICFSLYILQRLSLLPRKREQTLCAEGITFGEYLWGGVFVLFLSTLLVVYENTVIVLL